MNRWAKIIINKTAKKKSENIQSHRGCMCSCRRIVWARCIAYVKNLNKFFGLYQKKGAKMNREILMFYTKAYRPPTQRVKSNQIKSKQLTFNIQNLSCGLIQLVFLLEYALTLLPARFWLICLKKQNKFNIIYLANHNQTVFHFNVLAIVVCVAVNIFIEIIESSRI